MSALNDRALIPMGPLAAGHRLGRYEILAKLASGGMAIVYIANAQGAAGFERLVALKVLHANLAYEDEFIRMFLDEARLAARIRHPQVVSTIDISDSLETGYFLVMEYIEGDHLGALLSGAHKSGAQLGLPIVLRIIADALAGLGAAHDLRDDNGRPLHLVHRDVSPHNVLVGCDGVARLTDFGVAKAEDRLTHTRDGQIKGKLAYMAPEQASSGVSDQRSDLFSMGVVLWECVTGRRLFRAENTAATLHKLLSEEIAPPSAIDPDLAPLDPVLRKALERDPNARYQTADEFIEAVESIARSAFAMAPRRAVAEAVRLHAAPKLARERGLVAAAKRALQAGDNPAAEGAELPVTSEISLSSLTHSKPSGVFSNRTAPGVLKRGRSARPAAARSIELPSQYRALLSRVLPAPPPPIGRVGAGHVPEAPLDRPQPGEPHRTQSSVVLACLIALLSVSVWAFVRWSPYANAPPARAHRAAHASSSQFVAPEAAESAPAPLEPPASAQAPVVPAATEHDTAALVNPGAALPVPTSRPASTQVAPVIAAPRSTSRQRNNDTVRIQRPAPVVVEPESRDLLPNPYTH
jgi:serine/threonine protein kinase